MKGIEVFFFLIFCQNLLCEEVLKQMACYICKREGV